MISSDYHHFLANTNIGSNQTDNLSVSLTVCGVIFLDWDGWYFLGSSHQGCLDICVVSQSGLESLIIEMHYLSIFPPAGPALHSQQTYAYSSWGATVLVVGGEGREGTLENISLIAFTFLVPGLQNNLKYHHSPATTDKWSRFSSKSGRNEYAWLFPQISSASSFSSPTFLNGAKL